MCGRTDVVNVFCSTSRLQLFMWRHCVGLSGDVANVLLPGQV